MRLYPHWFHAPAALFALALHAHAGSLFYVAIPAKESDANAGLDGRNAYTSVIKGGAVRGGELEINGVRFSPLTVSGNSGAGGGLTFSSATGALANGGGKTESIQVDGKAAELFSTHTFNDAAEAGSEQYIVLDPAALTAGKTYDLRVYIANASGQSRLVNLAFAGDDQPAVETDFFNEDDATTSPGGFADPNQAYYINYRFTWDGATTPGVTITQRLGSTPFCLYAVTNQEVPEGAASAPPPGAVAEAPISLRAEEGERGQAIRTDVGQVEEEPARREAPREELAVEEDVGVTTEVFERSETLRNHGRWVEVPSYGRCWQPTKVSREWSPYTVGRWRYATDGGWTWDSDEEFGWATYHYGRWFRTAESGWCWVPGRVWAPSWCSWRYGRGHVGWAPLPPEAHYKPRVGVSVWADTAYDLGPGAYRFCDVRDLAAERVDRVILPPERNVTVITETTNITNITYSNRTNLIYSGGPNFYSVNNTIVRAGRPALAPIRIERAAQVAPLTPDGRFTQMRGNVFRVAAPAVLPPAPKAALAPVAAKLTATKIDKGWSLVPDQKQASAIRTRMTRETQGLTPQSAPAVLPPRLQAKATQPGAGPAAGPAGTAAPRTPGAGPIVRPGQPLHPGGPAAGRGGQASGAPAVPGSRPGRPVPAAAPDATPAADANATPAPGQPLRPGQKIGGKGNRPGPGQRPGPAATPAAPVEPPPGSEATQTPGQPATPASGSATPPATGKNGRKPGAPLKPGQPVTPGATPDSENLQPAAPGKKNGRGQKPGQSVTPAQTPGAPAVSEPAAPAEGTTPPASGAPATPPTAKDAKRPEKPGKKPGQRNGATPAPAPAAKPDASATPEAIPGAFAPGEPAPASREVPKPGKPGKPAPAPSRPTPSGADSAPAGVEPQTPAVPATREPASPARGERPGKKGPKGAEPVKPVPAAPSQSERPDSDDVRGGFKPDAGRGPAPAPERDTPAPAKPGKPGKRGNGGDEPARPEKSPAAVVPQAPPPQRETPKVEPPIRREAPVRAPEPPAERRAPAVQTAPPKPAPAAPHQPARNPEPSVAPAERRRPEPAPQRAPAQTAAPAASAGHPAAPGGHGAAPAGRGAPGGRPEKGNGKDAPAAAQ